MWLFFFILLSVCSGAVAVDNDIGTDYPCNLPKIALSTVSEKSFQFSKTPVIYLDEGHSNKNIADLTDRDVLIREHGQTTVKLSSSNTYSHGLKVMSLKEYITQWVDPQPSKSSANSSLNIGVDSSLMEASGEAPSVPGPTVLANESYYLFGHNYEGVFGQLNTLYSVPPCKHCEKGGAKTIGIGGAQSGVSFHFHGLGFSEPILGTKQWFLYPPAVTDLVQRLSPNMSVSQFVRDVYPVLKSLQAKNVSNSENNQKNDKNKSKGKGDNVNEVVLSGDVNLACFDGSETSLSNRNADSSDLFPQFTSAEWQLLADNLYECVIRPGEVLYFPDYWMHATLNLDAYNVFYSVFLDPQLMKD